MRPLQQAADGLTAVAASAADLLAELALGPRRLAAGVPLDEHGECLVVFQRKAADDAAAGAECVEVAVVTRDCRRDLRQIGPCAFGWTAVSEHRTLGDNWFRLNRLSSVACAREIARSVDVFDVAVVDRDEVEARRTCGSRTQAVASTA